MLVPNYKRSPNVQVFDIMSHYLPKRLLQYHQYHHGLDSFEQVSSVSGRRTTALSFSPNRPRIGPLCMLVFAPFPYLYEAIRTTPRTGLLTLHQRFVLLQLDALRAPCHFLVASN
jgi:hypothetical protein